MKTLKDFFAVVDLQTFVVLALAIGATYGSLHFKFYADIPTGLIGLAVVFPIVFSINSAYKRREEALRFFGDFKAHALSLYFAHRDWVPLENRSDEHTGRIRKIIENILTAIREDLTSDDKDISRFQKSLRHFSTLSESHESLRTAGVPANEISRLNQYLGKMLTDYERMRNIATYRTPLSLRAYSRVFLNLFPIAFGPYFAMLSVESETFPVIGYIVAALYSLVLVTLDNIQEDLEDPFDEVGTDDIRLQVIDELRPIMAEEKNEPR
jgi:predicted membrane chloride channel (bestrophin family)